jgi:hypothetical protein
MQVAMRAPRRDMIGNKVLVEGIEYAVGDQGVVQAHYIHVAGFKSLGFHLCKDESPDVAEVTTLSDEEAKAIAEMRKAKVAAKLTFEDDKTSPGAEAPKAAPAKK